MTGQLSEQAESDSPPNQKENAAKNHQMGTQWRGKSGKNRGDDELAVAWNKNEAQTRGKRNGSQMHLYSSGWDGQRNTPDTCKQKYAIQEKMGLFYAHVTL